MTGNVLDQVGPVSWPAQFGHWTRWITQRSRQTLSHSEKTLLSALDLAVSLTSSPYSPLDGALADVLIPATPRQLSYWILRFILPTAPPLSLPLFAPLLPGSALPSLFNIVVPLLAPHHQFSFRTSLVFAASLATLQEALHLAVVCCWRRDKKSLQGADVRGRQVVAEEALECSICLDAVTSAELEVFCSSCHTPLHRGCLLEWFKEVQRSATGRIPRDQQLTQAEDQPQQVRLSLTTFPPLPPVVHSALLSMLQDHDITSASIIEMSNNTIRGSGSLRRGVDTSSVAWKINNLGAAGLWHLGKITRVVVGSAEVEESTTAEEGVTVHVAQSYVTAREGEKWWGDFESEAILQETRETLLAKGEAADPLIATIISTAPGPTCPLCRGQLRLSVFLSAPPHHSTTRNIVKRVANLWKDCFGLRSLTENILAQLAVGGILRAVWLSRDFRSSEN